MTAVLSRLPRLKRIGLLATTGTVQYGMYQRAFRAYDVGVLVPDPTLQEQVMLTIYGPSGIKAGGTDLQATSRQIELGGGVLHNAGAEALLLACTELSVLFAHYLPTSSIPFVDAAQLIAEHVVLLAGGQLRRKNI
ncbi:MAG: aspartate/glutamate racemase family protein [Ktedonobacteraceae bacterium]|nr:aspartate/glutamate racemase family protein [Ktedonobacteraceae bacterium]